MFSVQESSPRGSILHTLFYLIFITAAQRKDRKRKDLFFILFCFNIDIVRMTMTLKRKKEQRKRRGKKEKNWISGIICTIYVFFNTLNLNIIFLSVYLNILWIKREREDIKSWNCPPIGKTGALAMLPNHHGNCFLYNFTIWCQSNRQRTCLQDQETELFILGQTTWTSSQIFFLWKLNWTVCVSVHFILFFRFLWKWNITLWPAVLQSHPILQTLKCLFL